MSFFFADAAQFGGPAPRRPEAHVYSTFIKRSGGLVGPSEPPFVDVCRAEGQFLMRPIPDLVF